MQFSYVVHDLLRSAQHWADVLHVGPFFVVEHVPYTRCLYRGTSTAIDMSVAIAYSGDVQIELVQQHNDAPSIFNQFLKYHQEGLQHVAAITDDLALELEELAKRGIGPVQEGEAENGTKFAYVDSDLVPGTMLELVEVPAKVASAFEFMHRTAKAWDPQTDSAIYGR